MTHARPTFPERLDRLAEATGVPALALRPPRRRRQRWWPLLALAFAVAGLVLVITDPVRHWRGLPLIWAAVTIGAVARARGPLVPFAGPIRPDEREQAELFRAHARAGLLIGVAAPLALAGLGMWAIAADWTRDALAHAVTAAGFFALAPWTILPTLFASWALPADPPED